MGNLFTRKFPEEFLKQCEHYELMSPNITPPGYFTILLCFKNEQSNVKHLVQYIK